MEKIITNAKDQQVLEESAFEELKSDSQRLQKRLALINSDKLITKYFSLRGFGVLGLEFLQSFQA